MRGLYRMVLVHREQHDLAREIGNAVLNATTAVLGRRDLLEIVENVPDSSSGSYVVVVYVGSSAGAGDPAVEDEMRRALASGFAILPVVRSTDTGQVADSLPSLIEHLNAVGWQQDPAVVVATIMRLLGLVEDERRIFLSYVRRDSAVVAEQLHRALQERQFDVFLDRFSVPPGADFQRRLTEDLADKAFLLLLESNHVRESGWVQYEINYALTHRIGVLAATMPNVAEDLLAPVDEAFRFRLASEDLNDQELTSTALDALLHRIEISHASALLRRREQLFGSLIAHLEATGCSCDPLTDWAIVARAEQRRSGAFLVTPRSPRAEDLWALDRIHNRAKSSTGIKDMAASLVHDVAHVNKDQAELLHWIGAPRNLTINRIFESELEVTA